MIRKLIDYKPRWFGLNSISESSKTIKIGFTFRCPCKKCEESIDKGTRLAVYVTPIDPNNLLAETTWVQPVPTWKRIGEDFETLTLEPSIDASMTGHWHGHIINGQLID